MCPHFPITPPISTVHGVCPVPVSSFAPLTGHMRYTCPTTHRPAAQLGGTLGALAYESYSSEKLISFSDHSWRETRGTGGDLVWSARQPCTFWLRDIKIEKYSSHSGVQAASPSAAHTQSVVLFSGDVSSGHHPMGRQASLELAAWLGKLRIPSHERGQPTGSPSQEGAGEGLVGWSCSLMKRVS